ncbi:MAG: ABC transporter permease [Candidatus Tectomicrobia bacterium]|uniref:ABC transporter permease n=1 Tax=Tectimicrobiota bacterium TaxID=2528274 RepID=A0A937VYK0_UNCTE|nr:ABC transporter permease [Candidatus Tectomicrobia bacterium]
MAFPLRLHAETRRKWRVFRQNRRGFLSLLTLVTLLVLSLFAEFYANSRPLLVYYQGAWYVPLWHTYPETVFGGDFVTEADYHDPFIRDKLTTGDNWAIYPPIRWDYRALNLDPTLHHPSPPSRLNWLGTDDRGRDVFARLLYGFRISLLFGLVLACLGTVLGMLIGALQGFFGGWLDLLGQRGIEIWGALPELYLLIILAATFEPSIPLLLALLSIFGWMGLSAYVRAEFLRARNFDYVKAARAMGVQNRVIMTKHILPNTLTPVVTFFPFRVSGAIVALTSLDFLNLGVPSPTPSLGELLYQAKSNVEAWWISLTTFVVLVLMVVLINFIGEALLQAFDPRRRSV